MDIFSKIVIPLVGVFVSALIALLVAKIQVRSALNRLDGEFRKKATEKLFDKRLEVYPELHSYLIAFTKKYWVSGVVKKDLEQLIQKFDKWEIENAILLSPLGIQKFRNARILFQEVYSSLDGTDISNTKARKKLIPEIHSLQMQLKTEIGILEADSYHNPAKIKHLNDVLRESEIEQ